ncbi:MAG: helix-turn-helix transcriptional regulator [Xanthobacteraceae bacterium]
MEVLSVADARSNNDALRASVGRLIETVGTPKFESEIFGAARHAINCEHISAVVAPEGIGPRILISAANGPMSIPRQVAEKYAREYWNLDPANQAAQFCEKTTSLVLRIEPEEDIKDDHYRYECYTIYRLVDRLSIMQRNGRDIYRMNFYAGGRYGRFADSDIHQMMNSADILMSLLMRHAAAGIDDSEERTAEMFRNRLRLVSPKMPQREAEVCTAIMLGMTSEAIAIKLGISVNTVLTYRKRAYGRLNISCQNELMRLILC